MLRVLPNKVFRAIVKRFLLTNGYGTIFEKTEQIPDAGLMLFGNRASDACNVQSDWDILILTTSDYWSTESGVNKDN
ncbi:MAG: hypothetical protein Q8941_12835 [Bacteroidota bacterium]|nr:hypothetical protein [Bacteroidota bacterium]